MRSNTPTNFCTAAWNGHEFDFSSDSDSDMIDYKALETICNATQNPLFTESSKGTQFEDQNGKNSQQAYILSPTQATLSSPPKKNNVIFVESEKWILISDSDEENNLDELSTWVNTDSIAQSAKKSLLSSLICDDEDCMITMEEPLSCPESTEIKFNDIQEVPQFEQDDPQQKFLSEYQDKESKEASDDEEYLSTDFLTEFTKGWKMTYTGTNRFVPLSAMQKRFNKLVQDFKYSTYKTNKIHSNEDDIIELSKIPVTIKQSKEINAHFFTGPDKDYASICNKLRPLIQNAKERVYIWMYNVTLGGLLNPETFK